ncbi:hypothetical protein FXO38_29547 [Capsicum annuum]|nr:hypothetical protein FXO38_29547 [Capsicum annuum]KAF3627143.1 hypothetical protein FXO37_30021 [Capsicum annuum]
MLLTKVICNVCHLRKTMASAGGRGRRLGRPRKIPLLMLGSSFSSILSPTNSNNEASITPVTSPMLTMGPSPSGMMNRLELSLLSSVMLSKPLLVQNLLAVSETQGEAKESYNEIE